MQQQQAIGTIDESIIYLYTMRKLRVWQLEPTEHDKAKQHKSKDAHQPDHLAGDVA